MQVNGTITRNHDIYWDVVKGIAVLLVLAGHAIQSGSGIEYIQSNRFYENPFFLFIYSFHMPLFMIISGSLFSGTLQRYKFTSILSRKSKSFLIPIFVFGTIWFFGVCRGNYSLKGYLHVLEHTLWFLQAVFCCEILVAGIWTIFKGKTRWITCLLVMILGLFIPDVGESAGIKSMYPCFLVGLALAETGFLSKKTNVIGIGFIACLILFLALFSLFDQEVLFYLSGVSLFGSENGWVAQLTTVIFRFFIGIAGSLTVIFGMHMLAKKRIVKARVLQELGKESKGMYCFQIYLFAIYASVSKHWAEPRFHYWLLAMCLVGGLSFLLSKAAKAFPALHI